jgi:hypothetical protein
MTAGTSDMATGQPIGIGIIRNGHTPLRLYGAAVTAAVVAMVIGIAIHNQHTGPGDFQTRACLEPVYAGLFGTGSGAMERCLTSRAKLFGARDAGWLRYVRHLEASCPATIGMQGQAICEFQVKAGEDHAGTGWRSKRYQLPS